MVRLDMCLSILVVRVQANWLVASVESKSQSIRVII